MDVRQGGSLLYDARSDRQGRSCPRVHLSTLSARSLDTATASRHPSGLDHVSLVRSPVWPGGTVTLRARLDKLDAMASPDA